MRDMKRWTTLHIRMDTIPIKQRIDKRVHCIDDTVVESVCYAIRIVMKAINNNKACIYAQRNEISRPLTTRSCSVVHIAGV